MLSWQAMRAKASSESIREEIRRVLRTEAQGILACEQRLSTAPSFPLEEAVLHLHQTLDNGGKIILMGLGKSGKIAQKIAATLCSTGSMAVYLHPTEGLHGDLGLIRPTDAVLALSYTGNTEELLRLVPSLKALKVSLICMGGNPLSSLAQQSQFWIDVGVEQEACPHNLAPTSSTTLALAMGDAIAMALMKIRGFEPKDFAQNHPGGSLGRRLNLTVGDVMHTGDRCAVAPPDATMDDIVILSTQKKLGGVLIVEGTVLKGLVTDGDIRRALKFRERFFQLKAQDVMTARPITASPEMLASEALRLMEQRESQISVLPVVDTMSHWKGLVRLHDLVQAF